MFYSTLPFSVARFWGRHCAWPPALLQNAVFVRSAPFAGLSCIPK
nr:MAG TPA: hypothetical protein [Caudoviricetes sp.]